MDQIALDLHVKYKFCIIKNNPMHAFIENVRDNII